ncbi:hypothetical protein LOH54_06775 [Sulfurimonas sp. HSL-3221]|uniref:hypothetical protein n=1 Tax=Sulfurimonadaceae TaxID=2771471 RepID=UPI001E31D83A|nr:hypothetical protein [Sulfurimonas sp. HSL-3221]UFS61362.1 hypothetical protein LOH54_06775 [Sulfurimonas sp. HSL-3221]
MQRAYRFAVVYFALFGLLLLASAAALFASKIGFSVQGIELYYLGSDTVPGKSAYGLLETAVPHLGAMGLFIMVGAHFLLFATDTAKRRAIRLALTLFAAALLDIVSGYFIASGSTLWVWIKLASYLLLSLLGTLLMLQLIYYAFWHSLSRQRHPR